MYNVDWPKFIRFRTPTAQRGEKWLALLGALMSPVSGLHGFFLLLRDRFLAEIQVNGQVRRLRHALNQRWDAIDERILIKDAIDPEPVFAFLESENNPLYLPVFLSGTGVDFIVCLPEELEPQEAVIRAFVDRYKLVTKRYRIEYI